MGITWVQKEAILPARTSFLLPSLALVVLLHTLYTTAKPTCSYIVPVTVHAFAQRKCNQHYQINRHLPSPLARWSCPSYYSHRLEPWVAGQWLVVIVV